VLAHLKENDRNILRLLSGESSELFMRCFRNGMIDVVNKQLSGACRQDGALPREFMVNHIAGSFIEMVLWWIEGGMRYTPRQLDEYFRRVMEPLMETP
jgi:hypothetical protein